MKTIIRYFSIILLLSGIFQAVNAQVSSGGIPPSFLFKSLPTTYDVQKVNPPDMQAIAAEDAQNEKAETPYRIAVNLPVFYTTQNSGTWESLPNGGRIWRLKINCQQAKALTIYYQNFYLPEGGKLFLYSEDKKQLIGAFTNKNNPANGYFATELIKGESLTFEYVEPANSNSYPGIEINEIAYVYRGVNFDQKDTENSGACEVNVKCPESENWQEKKKGVARILIKKNGSSYWCSGSLVNNTRNDATAYLLTADHCGENVSISDLYQWIFYFNLETESCESVILVSDVKTLTGATKVASGGNGVGGSDFYLVLLNDEIPSGYDLYFNGWSLSEQPSSNGVCIHHPGGDSKKISTYTEPLVATTYWKSGSTNTHWEVGWTETQSGHGVTEGGSSGSPLFDANGRIVGTLTGGESSCLNLSGKDYYGMFSYHWTSNGTTAADQLKPWLDPDNTGVSVLDGISSNPNTIYADFTMDADTIPVGGSILFTNTSTGSILNYNWSFEGGNPQNSTEKNPTAVSFETIGLFTINLTVSNDDLTNNKSIQVFVAPKIYPNPCTEDGFHLVLGKPSNMVDVIHITDMLGREIPFTSTLENTGMKIIFNQQTNGIYHIHVKKNGQSSYHKILKVN